MEQTQTRRERLREATHQEIKGIARRHMAEAGTGSLSLRAIAREMGLTSPALYRYYHDRDELVTALLVDAYNDLAATMRVGSASVPVDHYGDRYLAAVMAYREWALAHPVDFALIFGNPIPGYRAPESVTEDAARGCFAPLLGIMQEAIAAGIWTPPPGYEQVPAGLAEQLRTHDLGPLGLPAGAATLLLSSWALGQGAVTLEIFNHIQPLVGDPRELYRFEAIAMVRRMNLPLFGDLDRGARDDR